MNATEALQSLKSATRFDWLGDAKVWGLAPGMDFARAEALLRSATAARLHGRQWQVDAGEFVASVEFHPNGVVLVVGVA